MNLFDPADIPDLNGKTAIVTGANSGLGFYTSQMLARHGARVVMACRNVAKGEAAKQQLAQQLPAAQLSVAALDVSDLESVARFSSEFAKEHQRLDWLINNAGVVMPPYGTTKQGFELQIGTNFLGPFVLTARLLDLLSATEGARVVNIASAAHKGGQLQVEDLNWQQRGYNEKFGYAQSKVAILSWTLELNRRLQAAGRDLKAVAAHPGYAATGIINSDMKMANNPVGRAALWLGNVLMAQSAEAGAVCTLCAAVSPQVQGGDYIGPDGLLEMRGKPRKVSPTKLARDPDVARQLWAKAEELTGWVYSL